MNQVHMSRWTSCNANVFTPMAAQCLAARVWSLSPTSVLDPNSAWTAGPPLHVLRLHQWLDICSSLTVTSQSLHSLDDSKLRRPRNEPQCTDAYTYSMRRWLRNVDASALRALTHEEYTHGPGSSPPRNPGGFRPMASVACCQGLQAPQLTV